MLKHTPEPWFNVTPRSQDGSNPAVGHTGPSFSHEAIPFLKATSIRAKANVAVADPEIDAERIVACVNALAGIEDPESWVKNAKLELAALKKDRAK